MYAVNIGDWSMHKDSMALKLLLSPVVSLDALQVECEKGYVDGAGLVLQCSDERGEAICHIVRKRLARHQLRLYYSKTGRSWKRV